MSGIFPDETPASDRFWSRIVWATFFAFLAFCIAMSFKVPVQ